LCSYFYRHKFIHQMIFVPHLHPTDLAFINNYPIIYNVKNRMSKITMKAQTYLRCWYKHWLTLCYLVVEK
jgi:hypothetical protein